jgi:hypothetical protein
MDDTIEMLRENKVKVIFYVKPLVPKEWQRNFPDTDGITGLQIVSDLCQNSRCETIDLRYNLTGNQFTDSPAHYTVSGNKIIGGKIAAAILRVTQ